MKLFIKNMVCDRCIMMLRAELESSGLKPLQVNLGEAEIEGDLPLPEKERLNNRLLKLGFELIDDKKTRLIQNIKNAVIELIQHPEERLKINFSEYLAEKFHQDYSSLSKLFSEVQGVTLEQYVIAQKIEKVKELLVYEELSLSEISLQLGYSSVSHLSRQFKKVTGLTPTDFRKMKQNKRIPLDKI